MVASYKRPEMPRSWPHINGAREFIYSLTRDCGASSGALLHCAVVYQTRLITYSRVRIWLTTFLPHPLHTSTQARLHPRLPRYARSTQEVEIALQSP
jgi:hypothetical protein